MKKRFLTLALVALSACGSAGLSDRVCEVSPVEAKIYYGEFASDDRSTVKVITDDGHTCSGTVIGEGIVLTAKHCGEVTTVWSAFGGSMAATHTEFAPKGDLSIVFLAHAFDDVPIARIAIPEVGSALIQGFGLTESGGFGELNETTIQIDGFGGDSLYSVLKATQGADSCFGDSGGPVYQNGALVGVTSRGRTNEVGPDDVECGFGGVYTIPGLYMDWITEVAGVSGEHC